MINSNNIDNLPFIAHVFEVFCQLVPILGFQQQQIHYNFGSVSYWQCASLSTYYLHVKYITCGKLCDYFNLKCISVENH